MGGFRIKQRGNFQHLESFLASMLHQEQFALLDQFGRQGVIALANATPIDSGLTAESWDYYIDRNGSQYTITFTNSHMAGGVPVVILLQYGHATGTGGYVQGQDFINPAIAGTFTDALDGVWKAVVAA